MSFMNKALAALATATLALAPISASAAPVAARAEAPLSEASDLKGGGAGGTVLLVLVAAGFAYALYELISGDGDDKPVSP